MTETSTTKVCVACGKSVNGQKRMKDSQGRYWCMECGAEDKKKKQSVLGGNMCTACGQMFPAHQLSKWGSRMLCTTCTKAQNKGPGAMATIKGFFSGLGSSGANTGKLIKLLLIMGVLVLLTIWRYATL